MYTGVGTGNRVIKRKDAKTQRRREEEKKEKKREKEKKRACIQE